jgi:HPt (histidine-containing phosphotransfer) domain-containing protein
MSKELYDLSILSDMVYGDTDFMRELVETFIEYAPIDADELAEFSKEKNWDEASKKAHKLKSSIRTIGVTSLSDVILSIEQDTRDQINMDTICDRISNFIKTLNLVLENLKQEPFIKNNNE